MNLKQYISESERTYNYRLKTIVPLEDEQMDRIERAILKYLPVDITRPTKTMLQKQPLDFVGVTNAEVFIVDLVLGLPASPYVLGMEIRVALDAPETYVVVRGDNDPLEVEDERLDAVLSIKDEALKGDMTPAALLADPHYEEGIPNEQTDLYGNAFNKKFLDYLSKVQQERGETRYEPANPLFSWMDMPEWDAEAGDFNSDIPDAPKLGDGRLNSVPPAQTSIQGNLDDDKRVYKRRFVKKDGKGAPPVTLSRTSDAMRKDR